MRRSIRVLRPGIIKVNIIYPEIFISERRISGHGISRCAGARETRFECGCYNQHAGEDIVDVSGAVPVAGGPGDAHAVSGCVFRGGCLAQNGYWA